MSTSLNERARFALGIVIALSIGGCMMPRTSAQRLVDRARDLNMAARFGRMEVAAEHTVPSTRDQFLYRRRFWGNDVRVVDVNLGAMKQTAPEEAELLVNIAWTRMDEGILRATTLKQHWRNMAPGGWQLQREQRIDGDHGLLGEVVAHKTEPRPDVHFESRTIRPQ